MEFLLPAIALYSLLWAATYLLTFLQLMKSTLQLPQYVGVSAKRVPPFIKQLFQPPIQELAALGFQLRGYMQVEPLLKLNVAQDWEVLLYHAEQRTYATVGLRRPLAPAFLFSISFYTVFANRHILLTINGLQHAIIEQIPNTTVQDIYTVHTAAQWLAHQAQRQSLSESLTVDAAPAEFSAIAFTQILQNHFTTYINGLAAQRQIMAIAADAAGKPTEFKWSGWLALKTTIRLRRGLGKAQHLLKNRKQLAQTDPAIVTPIPLELELDNYSRMQQLEQGRVQRQRLGRWILLGSLVLFMGSFCFRFAGMPELDWQLLGNLIAVLLLHEAGHFGAMRVFGYRDTSMFFLPFFGAAVTGRKEDASLTEKVWVLLAGPLPGLLLGMGLLFFLPDANSIYNLSWTLIGLNLFNLLPIYPLDGGKIAQLLIFSRVPFADVAFKLAAMALFLLISAGNPFVMMMAVVVAVTIPADFRSAKLDRHLRRQRRKMSPPDRQNRDRHLHQIFAAMQQFGYGKLSYTQRYQLAKNLVQRSHDSRAHWLTRLLLVSVYGLSLLGSVAGTARALLGAGWDRQLVQLANPQLALQMELAQTTQTLQINPQDSTAYLKRARLYWRQKNLPAALADINQALRLDPQSGHAYGLRSVIRTQLGDAVGAQHDRAIAVTCYRREKLNTANQSIQANSQDTNAYVNRAEIFHQQKQYAHALQDYTLALAQASAASTAEMPVSESPASESPASESSASESPASNLLLYRIHFGRSATRQSLQDYQGALQDINQALQLNPKSPEAYTARATIRRQLGDLKGADTDTQTANTLALVADIP